MKKVIINTFKYLGFLSLGVFIFWLIYREIPFQQLLGAFREINYFWILASIIFGVLANLSRAVRWKMLIKPLGYSPKLSNTFLSVIILYFVNLIAPRAGEVARCSVLSRAEKIPFTKLAGTVFVERLADFFMLVILSIIIFAFNIPIIIEFFKLHPEMTLKIHSLISVTNLLLLLLVLGIFTGLFFFVKSRLKKSKRKAKIVELKNHFIDGMKSIIHMKNKGYFIAHTAFIFLMWLIMLYVVFLAYEPTRHLSIATGMVTFLMGGLAMLAPIQGGLGAWHFMVYETLFLYGIPVAQGKILALIAHSTTNLIYIPFGGIALLILFLTNRKLAKIDFQLFHKDQDSNN